MTIDEAIDKLKNIRLFMRIEDKNNECKFAEDDYEANKMAIQALEEVQQYRAIGTPEECRAAVEQEAKKVIEKYKAKAPEDIEAYGEDAVFGYCPVCGGLQNTVWNTKYCGDCGQKLDWSDEE